MKYKKIIMPIMATISISAPLATVVACNEASKIPSYLTDEDLSLTNHGLFTTLKKLSQSDESMMPTYATNVFEAMINTEKNGLNKDLVRLQDFTTTATMSMIPANNAVNLGAMVDTNVDTPAGVKQSVSQSIVGIVSYDFKGSNAFWTKHITKKDIIKPDFYNNVSDEINSITSSNKNLKFGLFVVQDKEDNDSGNGVYDTGEYTAYLFAMKQNPANSLSEQATTMFKDTSKFDVDVDGVKQRGGTYLLGNSYKVFHGPQNSAMTNKSIWGKVTTIKTDDSSAKDYLDRSVEDHLASWYGFGEAKSNSMTDAEKAKFDDLWTIGAPVQDLKTKEWFLSLTSYELAKTNSTDLTSAMPAMIAGKDALNISNTLIPMPVLNNFATSTYTKEQMQNIITNSVSFERAYSFVNKVLQNVGLLSLANTAIPYLYDISVNLAYMYQVKLLFANPTFFDELTSFIKTNDPEFDLQSFVSMLDSFTTKPDYDFTVWGAKRLQLLHYLPRFYKEVKQFTTANKNWESQLRSLEDSTNATITK